MTISHDPAVLAVDAVRRLAPYVPGKPVEELERELGIANIIKLASNENPLGPGPRARAAIRDLVEQVGLYPDGSGHALKARLGRLHDVDPSRITLGNGSNDLLVLLAEAFLEPGRDAVMSQYAFAVYPLVVQAAAARGIVVPALPATADQPLGHDLDAMLSAVTEQTRLVFVANPNNPTGTWLEAESLLAFLGALPSHTLAIVDEAYTEYAREFGCADASLWLDEFPNLVVVRTFSKAYGLAGLRVGYALSSPGVADVLNRVRQPFNVSLPGLAAAVAAIDDHAHLEATVALNRHGLDQVRAGVAALGLRCPRSAANFVLVDLGRAAAPVYQSMLEQGVIVRPTAGYGLPQHLRITIGTPEQNERMLAALRHAIAG